MMDLFAKDGSAKLVPALTFPVAGLGCVSRVYTDVASFDLRGEKPVVKDVYGITVEELRERTGLDLVDGTDRATDAAPATPAASPEPTVADQ